MEGKYIILSMKHGTAKKPVYWRADNCGYTYVPFAAGIYSEEQVKGKPDYYNDGYGAVAIPLTDQMLERLGYKNSFDATALTEYINSTKTT